MYYGEMNFLNTLTMIGQSRYIFLEFIPQFSLILVANQGAHDLHLFKIKNNIQLKSKKAYEDIHKQIMNLNEWQNEEVIKISENISLERVYIYKHTNCRERILGVNVQSDVDISHDQIIVDSEIQQRLKHACVRVYIFTSDLLLNCLIIRE